MILFYALETPAEQHPQTDKPYVANVRQSLGKLDSGPSHNHPEAKSARQIPVDLVEEESMESFPASDPPSHSRPDRPEPRRPGQDVP